MSVYREAREELATLLEDLLVRRISYEEFCDRSRRLPTLTDEGDWIRWPQDRGASVILDIMTVENYGKRWQKWESRDPKHESEDTSCLMRCLLFLQRDWDYEWDSRDYDLSGCLFTLSDFVLNILRAKRLFSRTLPEGLNRKYWPFCRLDDLEQALTENSDYLPSLFDGEHK